jgi:hypothetical protein
MIQKKPRLARTRPTKLARRAVIFVVYAIPVIVVYALAAWCVAGQLRRTCSSRSRAR